MRGCRRQAVDGIHASQGKRGCGCSRHRFSFRHAASIYQTSGSGESASEALKRRSQTLMASSFVPAEDGEPCNPATSSTRAGANGGGPDMRGDSIAAVWPSLEVIRDPYSKATQGIVLSWISLWDCETAFRSAAYKRVAFQVA